MIPQPCTKGLIVFRAAKERTQSATELSLFQAHVEILETTPYTPCLHFVVYDVDPQLKKGSYLTWTPDRFFNKMPTKKGQVSVFRGYGGTARSLLHARPWLCTGFFFHPLSNTLAAFQHASSALRVRPGTSCSPKERLGGSCTWLLSPPYPGSPQVTTAPDSRMAEKAP